MDNTYLLNGFIYRDVLIEAGYHLTCTNPGGGTPSVTEAGRENNFPALISEHPPSYRNSRVENRIAKDMGCSLARAESLFQDLTQFLWIASASTKACLPTPAIDEAWHVFLLFTKDYSHFCETYCGRFMHHEPSVVTDELELASLIEPSIDQMHLLLGKKPSSNWEYVSLKTWTNLAVQ